MDKLTLAERIAEARKRDFTHPAYNNGWDTILADVREIERDAARWRAALAKSKELGIPDFQDQADATILSRTSEKEST